MSIRAYRINKIEQETASSFNLWNDEDFLNFIGELPHLNYEGSGITEIAVEKLEEFIKTFPKAECVEQIQKDIKWAKKIGDEYVLYNCY